MDSSRQGTSNGQTARSLDEASDTVDFAALFEAVRRRFLLVVLFAAVGAGVGLGGSLIQEKEYSATASLLFRDPGFDQSVFRGPVLGSENADTSRQAATNLELVSLDVVQEETTAELEDQFGMDVGGSVEVEPRGDSNVVSLRATDSDPELAAELANAFAENFVAFRRQADRSTIEDARRLVESELDALPQGRRQSQEGEALQQQISRLRTLAALQTGNAEVVQEADVPASASSPKTRRNTIVGLFVGLLVGLGLAAFLERADRRLRNSGEVQGAFGVPLLGTIRESKALGGSDGTITDLPATEREAFRIVRSSLQYFNVDRDIRAILVGSSSLADGKSTMSLHLASAAASAGAKTILLECDLHRPVLSGKTGVSVAPGLAEVLTGQSELADVTQQVVVDEATNGDSGGRTLDVLVAGTRPPNAAQLLESREMASLVGRLKDEYDFVVLDTPPFGQVADAIPLTRLVDGILIVAQFGRTTRDEATRLREHLDNVNAPVLGVVVNRVRPSGLGGYYGGQYGYYSHYGPGTDGEDGPAEGRRSIKRALRRGR